MTLIVLGIILYIGTQVSKLHWRAFAILAALAVGGTALGSALRTMDRYSQSAGGDYFAPATFAGNTLVNFTLYALAYLAGYGFAAWRRRRGNNRP